MTDQTDTEDQQAAAPLAPTTYHGASRSGRTWLDARDRYDELTQRDLSARARATLVARGEYDPAKHGSANPEPLTLSEYLEVLANGEVVARVYRHPYQVHLALEAGATWGQIADATGGSVDQARREYREFAEGQHNLWAGVYGGERGKFGMNDADYAAAMARAAEGQLEPTRPRSTALAATSPGPTAPGAGGERGRRAVPPVPRLRVHRAARADGLPADPRW